jgi:class 3 adenylate cyclase/tetratricopeptide (TPR) repeat protein
MKCPKCQLENREGAKFCLHCGEKLELECPLCGKELPLLAKFCDGCGQRLEAPVGKEEIAPEPEGERKHATVLFSDLSGYTTMSEKLDPEELKEIMSRIFEEIAKVVDKYEGFIEKFVGDAVMALFGVPKAHEDDPIRAIKVARELHELMDVFSPEVKKKIGRGIAMHSGINSGLVVTGEIDIEKGTHGVAGDTVNLASRLCSLGKAGEILVGPDTYRQAEGHFAFESLEPTTVKGKAEPIQVYKVLSAKERPVTVHRLSGLRAELIGRKAEIAELVEAVKNLQEGEGRIFSICGAAGTGKSRLVEEFKNTLNLEEIQWIEGHAYAYSQNIPYFPLIDLLNRVLEIKEDDPPEKVREKLEYRIEHLLGKKDEIIPYVGSLYSLQYPEVENVRPEFWRSRLQEAAQIIISALAKRAKTIFFLEDLHWADPSFVELLRNTLLHTRQPAIVLCVYRPVFNLFTSHQLSGIGKIYQEIRLQDLSLSEAQDMLESLLKTEAIPSDLKRLVQQKAEGNPFYLEELVNSLIQSETLIRDNGNWKITKPLTESEISPTIHGLISGRLDRLERETKRILQEASVIGRAFLYDILKKISELADSIDRGLNTLERLDLIRTRSLQPDLEYMFKHPLTQEVVYNSLLKKDRQIIHEQIALVMEQLFQGRLQEFYETLAFHFRQGQSLHKALDYLVKSGEKSLERFAVEESHKYFQEAYGLLTNKSDRSKEEQGILIDMLNKWGLVFYYRGAFAEQGDLLTVHEDLAASLEDKAKVGMFYAWLGWAMFFRGQLKKSHHYLSKALDLGEEIGDQKVIGYACTWLTWTYTVLGRMDEGIVYGERAQEISRLLRTDQYLYFKSLGGLGFAYYYKGEKEKVLEVERILLDYGQRHSNPRAMVIGYWMMNLGHLLDADFPSALESVQKGLQLSVDPFYSLMAKWSLGGRYVLTGQFKEAEGPLKEFVTYSQQMGCEIMEAYAIGFLAVVSMAEGQMGRGLRMLEHSRQMSLDQESPPAYAQAEYVLGKAYLQIVERAAPMSFSTITKNIGFLVKNVPFASKKAEEHFSKSIEVAKEIGAKGTLGQAYLGLGLLHKATKKKNQALDCISQAIQIFEECSADGPEKQAKEVLASLG